jgi:glucose/arabinose dehydrogenase
MPDGRILYTEKSVGLSLLSADGKEKTLIRGTPRVYDDNRFRGGALIGSGWIQEVALHPNYEENGWIYLSYGDRCSNCNALSKSSGKPVTMLALVRGRIEGSRWLDEQTIWRADTDHYLTGHNQAIGARIAFDDKGHVFFSVGGISQETGIQDLDKPYGKIHRVLDNGRIPADNPFVDLPGAIKSVWSFGSRNPQGLAFNRETHTLWETEHGPRGGDELNLIRSGHNYGWPMVSFGMWYDGNPIDFAQKLGLEYNPEMLTYPVKHWTPSPGISSIAFYVGNNFPDWAGDLFVSTLRKEQLLRLRIRQGKVIHEEALLDGPGRFRDIEVGPDGNIYLLIEQYHGSQIVRMSPAKQE